MAASSVDRCVATKVMTQQSKRISFKKQKQQRKMMMRKKKMVQQQQDRKTYRLTLQVLKHRTLNVQFLNHCSKR